MRRVLAAVAAVGLLTACGGSKPGSGSTAGSTSTKQGTAPTVTVKNFAFNAANLTVKKGTKVTWKFEDDTNHNVTSSNGKFKSKDMSKGGTYSFTFNTPGKYSYICSIHQYMTGSVTVQ
ncbi:MAG: plastocyanin/azurin family copper-binding protein [Jatrophihabitantaceae bacterium]